MADVLSIYKLTMQHTSRYKTSSVTHVWEIETHMRND